MPELDRTRDSHAREAVLAVLEVLVENGSAATFRLWSMLLNVAHNGNNSGST